MVLFEYDSNKSRQNDKKHGITFEQAKEIWFSDLLIVPARYVHEPRWVAIGFIDGRLCSAVFTWRGPKIRIISCRVASKDEREVYYGKA